MTKAAFPADRIAGRIYAIGDVRGRIDLLELMLKRIRDDNDSRRPCVTRIVVPGDIVDLGRDSADIVRLFMNLSEQNFGLIVLKGLRELVLVEALKGNAVALKLWMDAGRSSMTATSDDHEQDAGSPWNEAELAAVRRSITPEILDWLVALPLSWREGKFRFRNGNLCAVSKLNRVSNRLQMQNAGFTLRRTWLGGMLVEQRFVARRPSSAGRETRPAPSLVAMGLEGKRRWTIAV